MKSVISIAVLVMCSLLEESAAFDQMGENDMYNCYYVIVCNLRKPEEFRRLITAAGPELFKKAFQWFREISRMPDAEDTPGFWEGYPDRKCAYDEDTKRDMFNEWAVKIGEFWARVCQEGDEKECKKVEDAANEFKAIMTEYTVGGDCVVGKKAADAMQGAGEDAMGGAMKPPSFG